MEFRITEEHESFEGLAWAGDGALLYHGAKTVPAEDLTELVDDELENLTFHIAPRFSDALIVVLTPGYAPPVAADDQVEPDSGRPQPVFDLTPRVRASVPSFIRPQQPGNQMYEPDHLEDLRNVLIKHFTLVGAVPDAVDFRITEEHDYIEGCCHVVGGGVG
ncbi:hypothetical protein OS965_40655 [Streptomyces sp. H27-G5]|uniref:hypothetical protein n=1 Tax=Streptomyces sp. H27-G5 TaxID=2996698 RepID=UPI002272170E|nr:hypothetical protein [Streptomyces sp. H27-G5]MCY0924335.1 hypothetical protein [Streptomyces sp. H27-G5]